MIEAGWAENHWVPPVSVSPALELQARVAKPGRVFSKYEV